MERQEISLRLAELDRDNWLDDEDPLTAHEKSATRGAPRRLREGSRRRQHMGRGQGPNPRPAPPADE